MKSEANSTRNVLITAGLIVAVAAVLVWAYFGTRERRDHPVDKFGLKNESIETRSNGVAGNQGIGVETGDNEQEPRTNLVQREDRDVSDAGYYAQVSAREIRELLKRVEKAIQISEAEKQMITPAYITMRERVRSIVHSTIYSEGIESRDEINVVVPPYNGGYLLSNFALTLANALGEERGRAFMERNTAMIRSFNGGFGAATQKIQVLKVDPDHVRISHRYEDDSGGILVDTVPEYINSLDHFSYLERFVDKMR